VYSYAILSRVCQSPAPTCSPGCAPLSPNLFLHFHSTPLLSNSYALFCATGNAYLLFFQSFARSFHRDGGCRGSPNIPTFKPANMPTSHRSIPFLFKRLQNANFSTPFFSYSYKMPGGVPPPNLSTLQPANVPTLPHPSHCSLHPLVQQWAKARAFFTRRGNNSAPPGV
jgi:hypothetical protein